MENQQQMEELTPEQLEARRDEMKEFYEKSIPYLESQAKYEKLLTEVEQARYQRATMQFQYANLVAASRPDFDDDEEDLPVREPQQEIRPEAEAPAKGKKLRRG